MEEEKVSIAQANAKLTSKNEFEQPLVSARKNGEFVMLPREEIDMMDVSPNQLVSVAASLIHIQAAHYDCRAFIGQGIVALHPARIVVMSVARK